MAFITLKVRQIRLAEVKIECDNTNVLDWIENALKDSFRDETAIIQDILDNAEIDGETIEVERRYDY